MKWEDNIFGMVAPTDWIDIGTQIPTRQSDPIDGLLGDEKTDNLVATWEYINSQYQIPMMAQFHAFDTVAQQTFRIPIDSKNIEKGLIKVKIDQSERLQALIDRGVQGDERLYEYVLNDGIRLADQVVTRTKVAKNELLATGQVTINENNLSLTVDYGVPSAHLQYTIDLAEDADIPAQIQTIVDAATNAGVTLTGMLTSKANLTKMRKNKYLQTLINGNIGAGALLTNGALETYLGQEFGITRIITNDLTYGASATIGSDGRPVITQKRYFPKDKIAFFAANPNGRIGTGLWGNPPEARGAEFHKVNVSDVSPYVYITQKMEWDPMVLWTKASGLFMPLLYNPNSLYVATVQTPYTIKVTPPTATVVVGATKKLTAEVTPKNATVTWTSGTEAKATVSDAGVVTGVAAGASTITASISDGTNTYTDICNVTVTAGA